MKQIIEHMEKIGDVLVQTSDKGEPLFIGMVKLGNKSDHRVAKVMVGTVVLVLALVLINSKYGII